MLVISEVASQNIWEYGIVGAVVLLLFQLTKTIFDRFAANIKDQQMAYMESLKDMSSDNKESLERITEQHKEERAEWRNDMIAREERVINVCDELIRTIHDTKK